LGDGVWIAEDNLIEKRLRELGDIYTTGRIADVVQYGAHMPRFNVHVDNVPASI
jgi:hypothetical protein